MVEVSFTDNLARHVDLKSISVSAATLSETFEQLFAVYPALKPYIFDEQTQLRRHVMLAVDQALLQGRLSEEVLSRPVHRLHIMQALSGG